MDTTVEYGCAFAGADTVETLFTPGICRPVLENELLIQMGAAFDDVGARYLCGGFRLVQQDLGFSTTAIGSGQVLLPSVTAAGRLLYLGHGPM